MVRSGEQAREPQLVDIMGNETLLPGPRPLPEVGHWKAGPDTYGFRLWAPLARQVELELIAPGGAPAGEAGWDTAWPLAQLLPMEPLADGYWAAEATGLSHGDLYRFRLDGRTGRPDPASHHQPHGVHGPSALVDHAAFPWAQLEFASPALSDLILYETHIGAFTPEGTFQAAEARLDDLVSLGITAVQVMPVAQFPGSRNWGYDGAYPFSVHHDYGGSQGLKGFVEACHARGLAVVLDVVFNHLGPEGNYLRDFGLYFTDRYRTPWGDALNYDGPESDHVRNFFFWNILHWLERFRVDGFRLDATHAVHDVSPRPFLGQLAELAGRYRTARGREPFFLAESDLNEPRLALPPEMGGLGLSAIYDEDLHHGVHAWLTGERKAYYQDYGRMEHVAKAATRGFAYTGQYSAYRRRGHGGDPSRLPVSALVAFLQNHDQTGNRAQGERLASLVDFEALKAAAGLLLLAPFVPMLFMGEEYGEENPFLYFISHNDPELVRAVRAGRLEEFARFHDGQTPPPDPQDEETFRNSKLAWGKRSTGRHRFLLDWHQKLIALRKRLKPGREGTPWPMALAHDEQGFLAVEGMCGPARLLCMFNLSQASRTVEAGGLARGVAWGKILDSAETHWGGPGSAMPTVLRGKAVFSPWSMAAYAREEVRS
ncbi:malto-oligosyltrehalose trehalohydrolase [Fundidesulfovibrio terrae]|uniref:malto-oligosyltrehalose trehalohydrolase n=1 Tax=Fundidesulfovibrio terrae TaxID=2922866 RepID=UPI001FB0108A|nr:malto-oligosyltrehalose trehalohydrolase [Fundidesulfovibrio terrae]